MNIRNEYKKHGVKDFYKLHKDNYSNPHLQSIHKSLDWIITQIDIFNYLDLACGNGEVSQYLVQKGFNNCTGCDPYFNAIYTSNLNSFCYDLTFEQIAVAGLGIDLTPFPNNFINSSFPFSSNSSSKTYIDNSTSIPIIEGDKQEKDKQVIEKDKQINKQINKQFDIIICSYALHLCPTSYFKTLLYRLAILCNKLVIISPSKYPMINSHFTLTNSTIIDRTHTRIFESNF